LTVLRGNGLETVPLPEPAGTGLRRKLGLPFWLLGHGLHLWREIGRGDAVHALVPGDIGTLGLLLALLRRKPLLVRHCGTWGDRSTAANRFLAWLLPRIAGGRNVVLATGGGPEPPAGGRGRVPWIFSTSLSQKELEGLPLAAPWRPGEKLRLICVGRLSRGKNAEACIAALPLLLDKGLDVELTLVGDGDQRQTLERLVGQRKLEDQVRFAGNLSHEGVMAALGRSHLFAFPTRVAEGFPKAVLEAMACGLPILVPAVSVLPSLVQAGGGTLLADTQPEDVAQGILRLTARPEALGELGLRCRALAEGLTLEAWRDEIAGHLRQAWSRPLGGPADVPTTTP
jgi:glycosyltransferase involved in cell wall biosynthesis